MGAGRSLPTRLHPNRRTKRALVPPVLYAGSGIERRLALDGTQHGRGPGRVVLVQRGVVALVDLVPGPLPLEVA